MSHSLQPCLPRRPGGLARAPGLTLVELLVVVAVVAVLASLVAPSFRNLILSNRAAAAASALQVSLSLARSEAIRRGADARVTVAANGVAGAWANGWTVFVDQTSNANGALAPTADSSSVTRLEVVAALGDVSYAQTGNLNYISYNGLGRVVDVSGAGVVNRSLWFYADSSDRYCLIINNTGRVRTTRVAANVSCPSA